MAKEKQVNPAVERANSRNGLSREQWIDAARKVLIEEGFAAVKVDRLAKKLNVTRGGFYWRFKNRADLLQGLLDHWERTNTAAFLSAVSGGETVRQRFHALARIWLDERDFDPALDSAVRSWGKASPRVGKLVRRTDEIRIFALQKLFEDAGYTPNEAMVRGRITYFHQIGYYAVDLQESHERREELSSLYFYVLGFPGVEQPDPGDEGAIPRL